jgi:hypothetical protein
MTRAAASGTMLRSWVTMVLSLAATVKGQS